MKRPLGIAVVAAAILSGSGSTLAADEDALRLFENICVNSDLRAEGIVRDARAVGFVAPPSSFSRRYAPPEFRDPQIVWKVAESELLMVVGGKIDMPEDEMTADVCALIYSPRLQAAAREVQTLLAVGAPVSSPEGSMFAYTKDGGRRAAVNVDSGRAISLMARGQLSMVLVQDHKEDDMTMLMVMAPKPN